MVDVKKVLAKLKADQARAWTAALIKTLEAHGIHRHAFHWDTPAVDYGLKGKRAKELQRMIDETFELLQSKGLDPYSYYMGMAGM